MANKRITELTELTSPASNDLTVIVDVSDTSSASSGTTKNIQLSNLLSADTLHVLKSGDTMSGMLAFSGTTHAGLQLNSLTTTQRDALTPANGMLINNVTLAQFQKYENSQWVELSKSPATKVVSFSGSGYAADIYTDGDADDVEIQAMINAANGGSVFLVGKGHTYDIRSNIVFPDNTTLFSDGTAILKAHASLGASVNMLVNADTTSGNTNILIKGINVDGNYLNRTPVVNDEAGHNIMLKASRNCVIRNVYSYNGSSANISLTHGTTNCVIDSCYAYNGNWHGILLAGTTGGIVTKGNTVRGCVVYSNGQPGNGVGIEISQYAQQNTINGNVSRNNAEGGIHVFYFSNYNTIIGNSSYSNGSNGMSIVDQSDYNTIIGNTIKDNTDHGIGNVPAFLSYGGQYNTIVGNTITNNGGNGLRGIFTNSTIEGNIIDNNGQVETSTKTNGIYMQSVIGVKIKNNTITNSGGAAMNIADLQNSTIEGNQIQGSGGGGIVLDTGSTGAKDSIIANNTCISNGGSGITIIADAQRCVFVGNVTRQNVSQGMNLSHATRCVIMGNTSSGNSGNGILLNNNGSGSASQHNIVANNTTTLNGLAGIAESGGADFNTYVGNDSQSNTGNNFTFVGSNNQYGHNTGSSLHSGFTATGSLIPDTTNTYDLGSASELWANVYTTNITIGTLSGVLKASSGLVSGSATLTDVGSPTADFSMNSHKLTSVTDPTLAQDVATKNYVDTNYQPLDATLTALAAYNTNGILTQTAADTFTGRTITGTSNRISITNGSGVSGNPTIDIDSNYVGQSTITTLGTITAGVWNGTTITETHGGTNQSSYTLGDILYASAANTLSKLAGNTTSTRNFLRQTGTGTVSAAPVWDTVTKTDVGLANVENTALSTWAGSTSLTTLGTIATGVWQGTAISHTFLTGIVQSDVGGLTTASTPTFAGLNLGSSALSTVGNIALEASAARDITIQQSSGAGQNLTVQAGNSATGGTNTGGGALLLKANVGTGNTTTGFISFYTSTDTTSGSTTQTLSEKMRLLAAVNGRLVLGATAPDSGIDGFSMGGEVSRFVNVNRRTGSNPGSSLTVRAGGAFSTGTDKAGGTLNLSGGISTGTGGSDVIILTATPAASTGNGDNTPTEKMRVDKSGNVTIGTGALATSATDGFLYIPTCAGIPSGTPTTKTGLVPMVYDTTNNNFYIYNGGGWKKTTTFV